MKKKAVVKDISKLFSLGIIKLEADFESIPQGTIKLFKTKKYKKCLTSLDKVLDKNPYNIGALLYKSIILKNFERYEDSNNCLDLFLNQFQYLPEAHAYQAENYLNLRRYDDSLEACKKYLFIDKDNTYIWGIISMCFFLKRKKKLAYAFLQEAENHVKQKETLYFIKGLLEKSEGKKDDALLSFIQSQKMRKNDDDFIASTIYNLVKK
jgi:tetratricopeptide (TPR) repeat protein